MHLSSIRNEPLPVRPVFALLRIHLLYAGALACLLLGQRWLALPSLPAIPRPAVSTLSPVNRTGANVPSLLHRATLILPQTPVGNTHFHWDRGYQWLSDRQILLLRLLPCDDERPQPPRFVLYDFRTRRERSLDALSSKLESSADSINRWQLSPDKRWLLAQTRDFINVVHLDGTGFHQRLDNGEWNSLYWLDGGKRLCSADPVGRYNPSLLADEPLNYATLYAYTVPELRQAGTITNTAHNPLVLTCKEGLNTRTTAQQNGDTFLTFNSPSSRGDYRITTTTRILVRDWKRKWSRSRSVSMRLPFPGRVVQAVFSPDAQQVAYILLRESGKNEDNRDDKFGGTLEIWVTTWETSASRFIGSVPCLFNDFGYDEDTYPAHIQWLPGGARLSFVYQDALWTVPASTP